MSPLGMISGVKPSRLRRVIPPASVKVVISARRRSRNIKNIHPADEPADDRNADAHQDHQYGREKYVRRGKHECPLGTDAEWVVPKPLDIFFVFDLIDKRVCGRKIRRVENKYIIVSNAFIRGLTVARG